VRNKENTRNKASCIGKDKEKRAVEQERSKCWTNREINRTNKSRKESNYDSDALQQQKIKQQQQKIKQQQQQKQAASLSRSFKCVYIYIYARVQQ
jgi:hypothetical protein